MTSEQGDAASHPSKLFHGGGTVTRGARYILVGFVELDTPGTRAAAAINAFTDVLSVYAPQALQLLNDWDRSPWAAHAVVAGLAAIAAAALWWLHTWGTAAEKAKVE